MGGYRDQEHHHQGGNGHAPSPYKNERKVGNNTGEWVKKVVVVIIKSAKRYCMVGHTCRSHVLVFGVTMFPPCVRHRWKMRMHATIGVSLLGILLQTL